MTLTLNIYAYLGGAWTSISADVLSNSVVSGTTGIPSNREKERIARPGSLSFTLKNNTGKYAPGSGAAHADWKKGTPIKAEFTSPKVKTKFIGYINKINLSYEYNDDRASVTALDWLYYASQLPLDIPALQTNQRGDQIITTILGFSPIQPTATNLQTGSQTFPYAFHDNTIKTTAFAEMSKVASSEWGFVYIAQNGTLTFEAYGGREATQNIVDVINSVSGNLLKEDGFYLLQEDGFKIVLESYNVVPTNATVTSLTDINLEYGERMVNRANAEVYPYQPGVDAVLVYKHEQPQLVPAGGSTSFRVQFTDKDSREPIAATAPSVKQYTLLHFDTFPDGVTGILDEADQEITNLSSKFTPIGGVSSTSVKKFGTASYSFNGTSDYIYSDSSQEKFNFRNGDFTVDWWEYRTDATAGKTLVSRDATGVYSPFVFGYSDGTNLRAYITSNGSSWDIASAQNMGTITLNTWVHYAITRSGNTYRTFKNGVQQATWTSSSTILASTAQMTIARYNSGNHFAGYIDEFRMIKGYAEYTADFTPPVKPYKMSGINWSAWTGGAIHTGTEITSDVTVTTSIGGVGLDITAINAGASAGYLNIQIFAEPLESLSPISHISEDATSINSYGYFTESIQMRLQEDISFGKTIAAALVAAEKNPRTVLNKISMVTKDALSEALFMDCDIGDLIKVTDSLSGYDDFNHIQQISWRAIPSSGGVVVFYDWILKEQ